MTRSTSSDLQDAEEQFDPDDRWVPVDRRWFGVDKATIAPAVTVLIIAAVMALVLPTINKSISYSDEVVSGDVMPLSNGVTFVPAPGWGITSGVRASDGKPAEGFPARAQLEDGASGFSIQTGKYTDDPVALLDQIQKNNDAFGKDFSITGDPVRITTASGIEGLTTSYTEPDLDGVIAVFVVDGTGIEVVSTTPLHHGNDLAQDVHAMITSIEVTPEENS